MTKKVLATLAVLAVLLAPRGIHAKTVCVQLYSGAVECREEEEQVLGVEHEPVDAALGDISPALLGGGLLMVSGILLYFSKKNSSPSFKIR